MQRDTMTNQNHRGDWDEQRERLSAYLDGEMNDGEHVALERHLSTCEQCQRTLDEFREVRALLRAMPMPASPRSFAIPTTGEVPVPLAAAVNRAESRERRTRGAGRWTGALQALGSFVAAAGVVLVLGSALIGTGPRYGGSASQASGAAHAPQTTQHDSTSTAYGARQTTPTKAIQDTPIPTPTVVPSGGNLSAGPVQPEQPANLPIVPIGAGMVAGGAALIVAGRVAGRKRRQA